MSWTCAIYNLFKILQFVIAFVIYRKVLSELTVQLSFYEALTSRLWKVVNCQLENADADLKTVGLQSENLRYLLEH